MGYCELLCPHVHLHILWVAGGLSLDGTQWRSLPPGCTLPKAWLQEEIRTRMLDGVQQAYDRGELVLRDRQGYLLVPERFTQWMHDLRTCYWNLHAEPVELGHAEQTPEEVARRTLGYLAAYANGVALRNDRLVGLEDDQVLFSYKDYYEHGHVKTQRIPALELIDRFLLHVLPRGMRHIRHYGFWAPNQREEKLPLIRRLLNVPAPEPKSDARDNELPQEEDEELLQACLRVLFPPCPACGSGVLVQYSWPRPTVARLLQMTLGELRQVTLPFW